MRILDKINRAINEEDAGDKLPMKISSKEKTNAVNSIMDYFKSEKSPVDSDVHALANKLKINPHMFEQVIYELISAFLGAGRFNESGKEESDLDQKELKMGIKVEAEHTTSPILAKRIACDHLAEIEDYYTRLSKMEKAAGITD